MKKLVSILVVAVMVLSLSACGKKKEEAEKTLNGFMDGYCELNAEEMKNYVDDDDIPIIEEVEKFDIDKLIGEVPDEFADYEEELKEILADFVERMKETVSYEVKEVEEKAGSYIFTLDVTVPDINSDELESAFAESVDQNALQQLVLDKYATGELTETSTEKDIYKIMMPEVIKGFEKTLDNMKVEEETEEKEIVVTEQNGKWLIDTKASDLD